MRNYCLLFTLTIFSFCAYAQYGPYSKADTDEIEKYFEYKDEIEYMKELEYNSTLLADNEKNRDTLFLQNFIRMHYDSVKLYNGFPYQPKELVQYLYAIDLNADQLLDVFYQGPTGAEANMTQIFLNQNGTFKRVFRGYQEMVQVKFNKNKLVGFTLYDLGCCANPYRIEYNYNITYRKNNPIFSLHKTIGYYCLPEKAKNIFNPALKFTITVEKSNIRQECYLLNNMEHPAHQGDGNIIARYNKGSKGQAIGYKKDAKNEWIYVRMFSSDKMDYCENPSFREQPTEIYGWILKKDTNLR